MSCDEPDGGPGEAVQGSETERSKTDRLTRRPGGGGGGRHQKEDFRRLMWWMAKFPGVEVLIYALMDNHLHILVKVPERAKFLKRFEDGGAKLLEQVSLLVFRKTQIAG